MAGIHEGGRRSLKRRKDKRSRDKRVFKKAEPKWKTELREIEAVRTLYETIDVEEVTKFSDFPLSKRTLAGLQGAGYSIPTDIQRTAIPLALRGRDVLGAAKTGSGKTLAFLIPVLELLWGERWTADDGVGALIVSPTRELAYQTFEVLKRVGRQHDLSAGLVIGGKSLKSEQEAIQRTNILVCTPGRLLQHMDETVNFHCSGLKLLVLDEADRILDLGFQRTINAIIENLPSERHTLLFSATQTKSVRDLARLSLQDPEYVAVHENSQSSTPHQLVQSYIICTLPEKLSTLYSFIKSHLSCKMIVFLSSCKQVKFTYEVFCRMRPGVPLMALYGRQKQFRRVGIYEDFCRKKNAVLLCTDVAARGLDFPAVDWVVQLDCPEDANTYIHRVGRTARYERDGKALLFLLPSEEQGMLEELETKKIPIQNIRVNPKKTLSIQKRLEQFCAQDQEVKHWAQRSFICYLRSVHLQANKRVFNLGSLPTDEYAHSLGLAQPPRIRFLRWEELAKKSKNKSRDISEISSANKAGGNMELEESSDSQSEKSEEADEEDEDILRVKRVILPEEDDPEDPQRAQEDSVEHQKNEPKQKKTTTKISSAKRLLHKKIKVNTHIKFDDEGEPIQPLVVPGKPLDYEESDSEEISEEEGALEPVPIQQYSEEQHRVGGINITSAQALIRKRDRSDRARERERIKTQHRQLRQKIKRAGGEREEKGQPLKVVIGGSGGSEEEEEKEEKVEVEGDDSDSEDKYSKRKRSKTLISDPEESHYLSDDEQLALHLLHS